MEVQSETILKHIHELQQMFKQLETLCISYWCFV